MIKERNLHNYVVKLRDVVLYIKIVIFYKQFTVYQNIEYWQRYSNLAVCIIKSASKRNNIKQFVNYGTNLRPWYSMGMSQSMALNEVKLTIMQLNMYIYLRPTTSDYNSVK